MAADASGSGDVRETLFDPHAYLVSHLQHGFQRLNVQEILQQGGAMNASMDSDDEWDATSATEASSAATSVTSSITASNLPRACHFLSTVLVNIVDPTAKETMSGIQVQGRSRQQPLELSSELNSILQQSPLYGVLPEVSCPNFRTGGSPMTLEQVPIKLETSVPGLLPSSASQSSSDWHYDYYAHVYLAACDSVEHYRTQVKPSIQTFLSQLESNNRSSKGKPSFLLVYCPTSVRESSITEGEDGVAETPSSGAAARAAAWGTFTSRVAAARQRLAGTPKSEETAPVPSNDAPSETFDESVRTIADLDEDIPRSRSYSPTPSSDTPSSGNSNMPTLHKAERDLLRRLAADFPTGRVCSLPSLVRHVTKLQKAEEEHEIAPERGVVTDPMLELELSIFWIELGATIVHGFHERCRRYDESLKEIAKKAAEKKTNWMDWILTKESWAFTYQQMQQPAEALLQYEELRALLPDVNTRWLQDKSADVTAALQGDVVGLRDRIKHANGDLSHVVFELEHYLLVRETSQLMAMNSPIRVLLRCKAFCLTMLQVIKPLEEEEQNNEKHQEMLAFVNTWVFEFCWDVQLASQQLDRHRSDYKEFARALCDILGLGRLALLRLARFKLPQFHGFEMLESSNMTLPDEFAAAWKPWTQPPANRNGGVVELFEDFSKSKNLVGESLASMESFEMLYMYMNKLLATNYEACDRDRHGACLRQEVIDIAIRRDKIQLAAGELREIARVYENDRWNACNFFLLFRLASMQRQFESAQVYLETLVRCFSTEAAPPKAKVALHDDLMSVINVLSGSGTVMVAAPIFRPLLSLEHFKMQNVIGTDRNLFKKVYSIGDTVKINISVNSFLPIEVPLDCIKISLVPFPAYVAAMEDNMELQPDDVFRELALTGVYLKPGENDYGYNWVPQQSGQFILSSVEIVWATTKFTYTAKEVKRPTIRIDVTPCKPTQKVQIRPSFLVPGHEQRLEVAFMANKDTIESGIIRFKGSPGLAMCIADGKDKALENSLELPLSPCLAGETMSFPLLVKSTIEKDVGTNAALNVETTTQFRRLEHEGSTEELDMSADPLECTVSAKVSSVGKRAFTVHGTKIIPYAANTFFVQSNLKCHAPETFTLQTWSIKLPSCLEQTSRPDLNACLVKQSLQSGDEFCLMFDCKLLGDEFPQMTEASLMVEFDNGATTKFTDYYTLRLRRPAGVPIVTASSAAIPIRVTPSAAAGLVGEPIDVKCAIETHVEQVSYKVSAKFNDWMLHGRTQGVLEASGSHELKFVAIPARPGNIIGFLDVDLTQPGDSGSRMRLLVNLEQPKDFKAVDPEIHTTVAFPALESVKL